MGTVDPVTLSVVVMHHPRRSDRIPALLAACQPLPVRVVLDPDPDGPPSPLRTAKRAWAAIAPGATHHVVLQDDILPMAGFAECLHRALAARPADGVTLSVQQTSPRNSYAVRRAALAGRAFAEMSTVEWTPTLALALPVAHAEELARYLSGLPDEYVDDDHLVTKFCAERKIQVVATVPNIVEHADVVSLSIYADEGRRPVTVYDEHLKIPSSWWASAGDPVVAAPERPDGGGLAIELRESRCGIRLLSASADEPLEHPFTWDWRDQAELVGVPAGQIVDEWRTAVAGNEPDPATGPDLGTTNPALGLEIWAAGFLLGADLQQHAAPTGPDEGTAAHPELVPPLRRCAIRSWLEVGLAGRDRRALTPDGWAALVDLGLLAATTGARIAARDPMPESQPVSPEPTELTAVLRRMARREASALLQRPELTTWVLAPATRVSVRPRPCPWCGMTAEAADPAGLEPMDEVRMLRPDEPPTPGSVTLHALACEWLTARSVLPLVREAVNGGSDGSVEVFTRAAATAEILAREPNASLAALFAEVDARESWLPGPAPTTRWSSGSAPGPRVLPSSSRLAPPAVISGADPDLVDSHPLIPHRLDDEPAGLRREYRRYRDEVYPWMPA